MNDVIGTITRENLAVYEASPGRVGEDVSQEAQVAHDYRGRLVYELLQNADDAMDSNGDSDARILFHVTDDALWVANTGRALNEADVRGLCGLGASSKVDAGGTRRASIGHKGLGFKSVLEITDTPMVLSTTFKFELGEVHARDAVAPVFERFDREVPLRLPAMRFPAPATDTPDLWHQLSDAYTTAFVFPFADRIDAADRARLAEQLLSLPVTTVLFLKHLEEVRVVVEQSGRKETARWGATRERDVEGFWQRTTGLHAGGLYRVTVESSDQGVSQFLLAHDDQVHIGQHREGLSGPAWDGVDISEVSVAVLAPDSHEQPVPAAWRHFHVFLPTVEPNPYSFLVNGAFTTDLSRQQLKVGASPRDYNGHLVRAAARLFRRSLAPRLAAHAPTSLLRALDADRDWVDGSAAAHLHMAVTDQLADLPFIPIGSDRQTLPKTLAAPGELGDQGGRLVELLQEDAAVEGARLPDPDLCTEPYVSVLAAHGAPTLDAVEALSLLAECASPERSRLIEHDSAGFHLDPVVELSVALWWKAEPEAREQLEVRAKEVPLFPVKVRPDGTVERIALGDSQAFYPPQSARQDLPLSGLAFMLHEVCWGGLQPNERKRMLDERMTAWKALFDVSDFRFEEVMRAAVLPAMALNRDEEAEAMRVRLQSVEALAAICQLAGSQTKPDRPLRYQRLRSDRALFNLSRLPVPCVVEGEMRWEPAFKVYFGRDWFPEGSVEEVIESLDDSSRLQLPRLAPPEHFLGQLAQYQDVQDDVDAAEELEDDEVGLDEDFDQPVETTERDQWVDFLSWVGVNRCLRPVHFHDVMDDQTGWLTTKGLAQPQGWAFTGLGHEWDDYAAHVSTQLDGHPATAGTVPYLYECHDLEGLGDIMAQAQADKTAAIARALWRHLALHWETYQRFTMLELAMVSKSKYPGQRAKPPRAMVEERLELTDNLWVRRLRKAGICPTSQGPRRPEVAWMPGPEVNRRFTRSRGRQAGDILPVLDIGNELPARAVRSLADRLGVRLDLNPSTFTAEDAAGVCHRLAHLYGPDGAPITAEALRQTIRPAYRQIFALLSGAAAPDPPMADIPMLAEVQTSIRFLPAGEVLYARFPGTKERSGVGDQVETFVIEADPAATRPLTAIFGMPTLEDALEWEPDPGDPALDDDQQDEFRTELRRLAPWLLARLRADRAEASADDQASLLEFIELVEPVTDLQLACWRDGERVSAARPRSYYVANSPKADPGQAFLVWEGTPWPPNPEARQALAMAMADALGVNHVETFLAFIDTDNAGRRQLLDLAGATSFYDEIVDELREPTAQQDGHPQNPQDGDAAVGTSVMTPAPEAEMHQTAAAGVTPPAPTTGPGAASIPLVSLEDFELVGDIELVAGDPPTGASSGSPSSGWQGSVSTDSRQTGGQTPPASRAAPGMDLSQLDRLGMLITMDYELRRLHSDGFAPQIVPGQPESGSTVVVDVSTPAAVKRAKESSTAFKTVLEELRAEGVSELHPGFDILTIAEGRIDRVIELKSSGVDTRVQAMSWNEWKSASKSVLRDFFWLYLVNNLRADLPGAPYIRAIHDPFGTLLGKQTADTTVRRAVQLRVREFEEAEQLTLQPRSQPPQP